jgi:hypothetical protein
MLGYDLRQHAEGTLAVAVERMHLEIANGNQPSGK